MKISGSVQCERCWKNLTKAVCAAWGLEEHVVHCPSCATVHAFTTHKTESNETEFEVSALPRFRLPGYAIIGNPIANTQFFFQPVNIDVPDAVPTGFSPFDCFSDYLGIADSAYEAFLVTPGVTHYGIGSIPRFMGVIPEELFLSLGHRNAVLLVNYVIESTKYLKPWIDNTIKSKRKGVKPPPANEGVAIALSLMMLTPFLTNVYDVFLGDDYTIGFEGDRVVGVQHKNHRINLHEVTPPERTAEANIRLLLTNRVDYIRGLRHDVNKRKSNDNQD